MRFGVILFASAAWLALSFAAPAEVTFYGLGKVVGWDEQADSPVSVGKDSSFSGRDMFLVPYANLSNLDRTVPNREQPNLDDFLEFDIRLYASAVEEGYKNRLPSTPEKFHELQMKKRCDIWAQNGNAPERLCDG